MQLEMSVIKVLQDYQAVLVHPDNWGPKDLKETQEHLVAMVPQVLPVALE